MMAKLALALAALLFIGVACAQQNDAPPVVPVASIDLERYAGLWYEIALIPNRFQKNCAKGTTARYALREDGRIDVTNRCIGKDGGVSEARGVARIEDASSNAKLKVNFFKLLGMRLFWGDYWIIGLGEDYEYAVVGTPDRKYGWILSRTPDLEPATLKHVFEVLRGQGYDPADFEMTAH